MRVFNQSDDLTDSEKEIVQKIIREITLSIKKDSPVLHVSYSKVPFIKLWLSGLELQKIPESVQKLTQIQCINLSHNNLRDLPEWFSIFSHLNQIILDDNCFTEIPSILLKMPQLTHIRIAHNRIQSVPPELFMLPRLRELDICENRITTLPPNIISPSLETLMVNQNRLRTIPIEYLRMPHLSYWSFSANPLRKPWSDLHIKSNVYQTMEQLRRFKFQLEHYDFELVIRKLQMNINLALWEKYHPATMIQFNRIQSRCQDHPTPAYLSLKRFITRREQIRLKNNLGIIL